METQGCRRPEQRSEALRLGSIVPAEQRQLDTGLEDAEQRLDPRTQRMTCPEEPTISPPQSHAHSASGRLRHRGLGGPIGKVHTVIAEVVERTRHDRETVHGPGDSPTRGLDKLGNRLDCGQFLSIQEFTDPTGQRMIGLGDEGTDPADFRRIEGLPFPTDRSRTRLRQGSGLVQDHAIHPRQGLQNKRVLEVDSQSPQHPLGRSQSERRGQRQCTRTGHDEHRNQRLDGPDPITHDPPCGRGTAGDHQEQQ